MRVDRGHVGLLAWGLASSVTVLSLYSQQLEVLTSGLGGLLDSTLGSVFPAYPFLALLFVLTSLQWRVFHRALLQETASRADLAVRGVGALLVVLPAALWGGARVGSAPSPYLSMEVAAFSLVVAVYGVLLVVNPVLWRPVLPYASLYGLGLLAPLLMLDYLGAPLATISSSMAASMTTALGLGVAWQGTSFAFLSAGGEKIGAVVTPVCSAAYSISIYLALLGLMYLDLRRSTRTTLTFAFVGVPALLLVNSARISLTIWLGFLGGPAMFWGVHDWLGYGMFFAFYIAALASYSSSGRTGRLGAATLLPGPVRSPP